MSKTVNKFDFWSFEKIWNLSHLHDPTFQPSTPQLHYIILLIGQAYSSTLKIHVHDHELLFVALPSRHWIVSGGGGGGGGGGAEGVRASRCAAAAIQCCVQKLNLLL